MQIMGAHSELSDALAFIVAQQQTPATACAYLGTDAAEIAADLAELDQPWAETLRVAVAEDGRITGAATIEWDADLGRSWVYGPWADDDAAALELLRAVIGLTPESVTAHEMFASTANERQARLAENAGWVDGGLCYGLELAADAEPWESAPALGINVRPAVASDLAGATGVTTLHDAEFPGTYASAAELLDPDEDYRTLVAERDGVIVGYLTYQNQDDGAVYIDFVAVNPAARRTGVGRALVTAARAASAEGRLKLTVNLPEEQSASAPVAANPMATADRPTAPDHPNHPNHQAALPFYQALGFRVTDTLRAYHSQ